MPRARMISSLLVALALAPFTRAGAEGAVTPALWRQHVSPGGFSENLRSLELGGGQLDADVSARYRLRWNGFASDQDVYTYLRANLTGARLGQVSVDGHLFLRAGFDLDGTYHRQFDDSFYYVWRDALDAERDGHVGALRAYTANAVVSLPGASLTVGRAYLSHLHQTHLDGGELSAGTDKLRVFAFAGRPVSFFLDTEDDWVYGAGLDLAFFAATHLRADYLGMSIEDVKDDAFAARVDQGFVAGPLDGNVYAEYRYLDGPSQIELAATGKVASTGTTVTARYRQLLDDAGVTRTQAFGFPVNPFSISLLAYGKHQLYHLDLSQAVTRFLLVSASVDFKHVGEASLLLDNRSYRKYRLALDLDALPTAGTHLQLFGEAWNVDQLTGPERSGRLHGGLRISQAITTGVDAWAGTSWEQYEFDQASRQVKEAVRKYYLGVQWAPTTRVKVLLDLDAENSDVFDDLQTTSLVTNYTAQATLSVAL